MLGKSRPVSPPEYIESVDVYSTATRTPRPARCFRAPPAAAAAAAHAAAAAYVAASGGADCRRRRGAAGWRRLLLRLRRWLLALQEPAQQQARGRLVETLVGVAAAGPVRKYGVAELVVCSGK